MAGEIKTWYWNNLPRSTTATDMDDVIAYLPEAFHVSQITFSASNSYFHNHGGNYGNIRLRIAGTETYVEVWRGPVANVYIQNVTVDVAKELQRNRYDAIRFTSNPAVNQGMHGWGSFHLYFTVAAVGAELREGTAAYGTRAYGGGAPIVQRGPVYLETTVAAGASASMGGFQPISLQGDILVRSTSHPSDIVVMPPEGPDTLATGPAGVATMSADTWQSHSISMTSAGKATSQVNVGIIWASFINPAGRARMGSLGIFQDSWYLGSPWHVEGFSVGVADGWNTLTTQEFPTEVYVYPSTPTGNDVLLAPDTGPGELSGMVMTCAGKATAKTSQVLTHVIHTKSDGEGAVPHNYMGSPWHIDSVMAGVAGAIDINGNIGSWYLGTPLPTYMGSNGRGHMPNYLGSPWHVTMTSKGIAAFKSNRFSGAVPFEVTMRGISTTRDQFGNVGFWYLGSPHRIAMTSAGRAGCTENTLGSLSLRMTIYAKGHMESYLGSAWQVAMTSRGKGGGILYLGSRVYMAGTSPGRGGGFFYMGSPVRDFKAKSAGRGGGFSRLGGTFTFPNITMRGVATMILGPKFLDAYSHGVGRMANVHLAGTQRIASFMRGVGHMRENSILLTMRSNGSARGTEFDKPPFAFVAHAGARSYDYVSYRRGGEFSGSAGYTFAHHNVGVFAYMSSTMGFGNYDPNRCHIGSWGHNPTPSTLAGRGGMSFPYEMVARADAGCLAYHGYRADYDYGPRPPTLHRDLPPGHNHGQGYTGMAGVFATQIGVVYQQATTNSYHLDVGDYWYLSSRVYYALLSRGFSTMQIKRVDEMDMNGVGGMVPILGATNRYMVPEPMNGVGDWRNNYLPDIRKLHMRTNGKAGGQSTIAGNVHFGPGLVTSRGVGHFFIDPGLMKGRANGVGRMTMKHDPTVYMEWGISEFYWVDPDNFPVADPILIPKSSSGISHVEIEIDTIPIMRNKIDSKGLMSITKLNGLPDKLAWHQCAAGSHPWYDRTDYTNPDATPARHPMRPHIDYYWWWQSPNPDDPRYHKQGVELFFTPVEVVWNPIGIATVQMHATAIYMRRWHTWEDGGAIDPFPDEPPHYLSGYDSLGRYWSQRRAGGIGQMFFRPDPKFQSVSRGRGDVGIRSDTKGIFGADLKPNGISTVVAFAVPGEVLQDLYGDMLALNFSVDPQAYGQGWPRRFTMSGLPV